MTAPEGLGGWVAFERSIGNEAEASALADEVGCKWVAPRAGDGALNDGSFRLADIAIYQRSGKRCYPWWYSRPSTVDSEIRLAGQLLDAGADGLIVDAEIQYEGHELEARRLGEGLRKRYGDRVWIADAPWPWILYHPMFPERAFADFVDARLLQDYWCEINRSGARKVTAEAARQWAARYAEPGRTDAERDPIWPIACTYGRAELVAQGAPPCPGDMTVDDLEWFLDAHAGQPVSIYSLEMLLAKTTTAGALRAMLRERAQRTLVPPPLEARPTADPLGDRTSVLLSTLASSTNTGSQE